jgi:ABC-type transporter Mla subunit MlaD
MSSPVAFPFQGRLGRMGRMGHSRSGIGLFSPVFEVPSSKSHLVNIDSLFYPETAIGLDDAKSGTTSGAAYPISAGPNRALVIALQHEGDIPTPATIAVSYGGQALTRIVSAHIDNTTFDLEANLFLLLESGITAAVGNTIVITGAATELTWHARSYKNIAQTGTVFNTSSAQTLAAGTTPNPLITADLTGSANAIVVAFSVCGNATTASWGGTRKLIERTDQLVGTSSGSMADRVVGSADTTVSVQCTWASQNRAAVVAMQLAKAPLVDSVTASRTDAGDTVTAALSAPAANGEISYQKGVVTLAGTGPTSFPLATTVNRTKCWLLVQFTGDLIQQMALSQCYAYIDATGTNLVVGRPDVLADLTVSYQIEENSNFTTQWFATSHTVATTSQAITAVSSRAIVASTGFDINYNNRNQGSMPKMRLTSTTNVDITTVATPPAAMTAYFHVVDFTAAIVNSVAYYDITHTGTTNTHTITAINPAKSLVVASGGTTAFSGNMWDEENSSIGITSATEITSISYASMSGEETTGVYVVEFVSMPVTTQLVTVPATNSTATITLGSAPSSPGILIGGEYNRMSAALADLLIGAESFSAAIAGSTWTLTRNSGTSGVEAKGYVQTFDFAALGSSGGAANVTATRTDAGDVVVANLNSVANVTATRTDAGDAVVANLNSVANVTATRTDAGDVVVANLNSVAKVTATRTDAGDVVVANLNSVAKVTATRTDASDAVVANLKGVAQLTATRTDAGDAVVANLNSVAKVTATRTDAGDAVVAVVSTSQIANVTATRTDAGDAVVANLKGVAQLTATRTDAGDAVVANLKGVAQLTATRTDAGDAIVANLKGAAQLTATRTDAGDTVVANLKGAAQLTATRTDAGDTVVANLKGVAKLTATRTDVGDAVVANLNSVAKVTATRTDAGDAVVAIVSTSQIANVTATRADAGDAVVANLNSVAKVTATRTDAGDAVVANLNSVAKLTATRTDAGDTVVANLKGVAKLTATRTDAGDAVVAVVSTSQIANVTATRTDAGDAVVANLNSVAKVTATRTDASDAIVTNLNSVAKVTATRTDAGDAVVAVINTVQTANVTATRTDVGDVVAVSVNSVARVTATRTDAGDTRLASVHVILRVSSSRVDNGDTITATIGTSLWVPALTDSTRVWAAVTADATNTWTPVTT